jgi:mannose PTS system EIIC component
MTVIQAVLLALFCYLGALTTPWALGTSGGWYVISRPLVAGLLCGLVLGDVKTGVLIGIAVQAVYIGLITPGGAVPADLSFVCYLGIPLAMVAHLQPAEAVSISVGFGIIGVAAWQLLSVGNAGWAHLGDRYAEEGNLNGIIRINYLAQIGTFILRFILPFAVLYFGAGVAQNLISAIQSTAWGPALFGLLGVLGGALPAIGIAILMVQITSTTRMLMWFVLGWAMVVYLKLNPVSVAIFGGIIAIVFFLYFSKTEIGEGTSEA